MPPNKSGYKKTINLELEKLKNGEIQGTKIDLTKIKTNTLAKKIGLLSEDVKMCMYLPTARKYYALDDRTINLLMKRKIDMNATTGGSDVSYNRISISDAEAVETVHKEKEVEMFIVYKNRTRAGGPFFPYLNIIIFDLSKYCIFKSVDTNNYKHNCLYLVLQAGGLSDIKLQELILSLRNRHIHKCDLENVCKTLEIHIELISLRSNGENRVEHYGKDFDENAIWVWLKAIIS